jgi:alkyl sulfatase BDS1-like metallo-beta-lactamase superfamily hydrolase
VASEKVSIIAPGTIASIDKFAIGENIVVGNAMPRRASYAFGNPLDINPPGMITCGFAIGAETGSTISYISPTDGITKTGTKRDSNGVLPEQELPRVPSRWRKATT